MMFKIKRLLALTIDLLPYVIFLNITAPLFNSISAISIKIIFALIYYALLGMLICIKDIVFGYESIGKKLMKMEIVDINGKREMNKLKLFKRNFYSLFTPFFPLYPYMILYNNKSFGDYKTKLTIRSIYNT